jgi:hypothetical protein
VLKSDKDVVLVAVEQFGYALRFASDELKNDKGVVLVAVVRALGTLVGTLMAMPYTSLQRF